MFWTLWSNYGIKSTKWCILTTLLLDIKDKMYIISITSASELTNVSN